MHFLFLTILFSFFPIIITLKCPSLEPYVVQLSNGQCYYIMPQPHLVRVTREEAENECALLGDGSDHWNLPKLDTTYKSGLMVQAIRNVTNLDHWMIWIDLYRHAPIDASEALNTSRWGDESKWIWTVDGSTLEQSFPSMNPPWLPSEPTNGQYIQTRKASDLERCVIAELNKNRKMASPKWYDMSCEVRASHFAEIFLHSYVLVCESWPSSIVNDTTTFIDANYTINRQRIDSFRCTDGNRWQGLVVGLVLGSVIGMAFLTAAYYLVKCNRKKETKAVRMEFKHGENVEVPQNGLSNITWMGDGSDDKERFFM